MQFLKDGVQTVIFTTTTTGLSFSLDGRCGLEFSLGNSKFSLENLKELSFSSFLF